MIDIIDKTTQEKENKMDEKVNDKKELTPRDPGHADYDPLKDPRVRAVTEKLHSKSASYFEELTTLKAAQSKEEAEQREKENKGKTELQKALERLEQQDIEIKRIQQEREIEKKSIENEKKEIRVKTFLQDSLLKAQIVVNTFESKGLLLEVQDKLKTKLEGETEEDIIKMVVSTFIASKKTMAVDSKVPKFVPGVRNSGTDIMTKLKIARDNFKNATTAADKARYATEMTQCTKGLSKVSI